MAKHRAGRPSSSTGEIDMTPRYAPKEVMVAHSGRPGTYPVTQYRVFPPGTHPNSGIINDMTALELVTVAGSRWYGVSDAYINSQLRMVVIGTNRRDEVRMKWKIVPKQMRR
jgi:hypothetical protein